MKIIGSRLKLSEYVRSVYHATPEAGTPLRELLKPEYWAHVSKQLKVGDRIEVDAEERTWFAELYVRGVTPTSVTVFVMRHIEFTKPESEASTDEEYSAKHAGRGVWRVIRNSDKAVVKSDFATKEAAEAWIEHPVEEQA